MLIEAFNDDVDEMWLAKTVAFSAFGDAECCKKHLDGHKNIYGTRFNTGDYMVAASGSAKAVTASGASSSEAGAWLM